MIDLHWVPFANPELDRQVQTECSVNIQSFWFLFTTRLSFTKENTSALNQPFTSYCTCCVFLNSFIPEGIWTG